MFNSKAVLSFHNLAKIVRKSDEGQGIHSSLETGN